ncbi:MAG: GyrI-like domain-containing protein [Ignavibacteriae bacterium]|nr:GyrI-like domain-containing protein [Ignavibacteriota bacterium]
MLSPTFIEIGAKKVIGCAIYTSGIKTDFPNIWDVFIKRVKDIPNLVNPTVTYALEFYGQEFNTEGKWFYMPCVEVGSFDEIPMLMVCKTIPASRYAVFSLTGGVAGLHDLFMEIYKEWLPHSSFELAFDFDMEVYDERFKGIDNPETVMEVRIPIRDKAV